MPKSTSRGIRLQKFLAGRGVASRRSCEELIAAGRVSVNGAVVTRLGTRVDPERDAVAVDGKAVLPPARRRVIMLNKPRGYVCSTSARQGRTVYKLLANAPAHAKRTPQEGGFGRQPTRRGPQPGNGDPRPGNGGPRPPGAGKGGADMDPSSPAPGGHGPSPGAPSPDRLVPVGRLDKDSEGLLLMSNDGELVHRLSHPRYEHEKTYRVTARPFPDAGRSRHPSTAEAETATAVCRASSAGPEAPPYPVSTPVAGRAREAHAPVSGRVTEEMLARLRRPFVLDGYRTRPAQVRLVEPQDKGASSLEFEFTLKEGRKRQIRRMCEEVGLRVERLVRVSVGPQELGNLLPGRWRELSAQEVERLT